MPYTTFRVEEATGGEPGPATPEKLQDAVDLAADQDQPTLFTEHGKPAFAVVPAEFFERALEREALPWT